MPPWPPLPRRSTHAAPTPTTTALTRWIRRRLHHLLRELATPPFARVTVIATVRSWDVRTVPTTGTPNSIGGDSVLSSLLP